MSKKKYEVKEIVSHRIVDNKIQYKVRWMHYSEKADTWESVESFKDKSIVTNYEMKIAKSNTIAPPFHRKIHILGNATPSFGITRYVYIKFKDSHCYNVLNAYDLAVQYPDELLEYYMSSLEAHNI